MGYGSAIRQLRLTRGLSQRQLAKISGVSQASISYIEDNDVTRTKFVEPLARALDVSPSMLEDLALSSRTENVVIGRKNRTMEFVQIPEYEISFSAGHGNVFSYEVVEDSEPKSYSLSFFQRRRINPAKCKRFKVYGDSMEPVLRDGDSVLVVEYTPGEPIRDGSVYIVRYDRELRIKRLSKEIDGSIILRSDNPEYRPVHIPTEEVGERFQILGRAIERSGTSGL